MSSTHQLRAIKGKPSNEAGVRRNVRPLAAPVSEHDRWMELQRGIGNQAVSRMLQRGAGAAAATAETGSTRPALFHSAQQVLESKSSRMTKSGL